MTIISWQNLDHTQIIHRTARRNRFKYEFFDVSFQRNDLDKTPRVIQFTDRIGLVSNNETELNVVNSGV